MLDDLLRFNKNAKYCFFDFETECLCLHLEQNLPWQVAMLKVVGNDIVSEYKNFIKWYRPARVSEDAAKITHFKPEFVTEHGVDYKQVVKDVVDWTSEADFIIGHNVLGFDVHFLSRFYKMEGKSPAGLAEKIIDTNALAKGLKTNIIFDKKTTTLAEYQFRLLHMKAKGIKTRLEVLGHEYGIEHDYEGLHDALADIRLNKKVWDKLKFQVDI